MKLARSIAGLRELLLPARESGAKTGFVPTMGSFHEGHLSLMRAAAEENDVVSASIFVNPAQFSAGEDFEQYPRDLAGDAVLAEKEGVDYLFAPPDSEMYPQGFRTLVEVEGLGGKLCGKSRPGHFRGVATVVAKLLNICAPDALYLGQKDAQQAVIIRTMVRDLNIPAAVRIMPTVREKDGLAMSSRNSYLTPGERKRAPALFEALSDAKNAAERGGDAAAVVKKVKEKLSAAGLEPEYAEVVSPGGLEPLSRIEGPALLAAAARLGRVRLIDNVLINCGEL